MHIIEPSTAINVAKEKLSKKHCDWIVVNDISDTSIGFDSEMNEVSIIYGNDKIEKINKNSKSIIAHEISKKIIANFC